MSDTSTNAAGEDLSAQIATSVEKRPGDSVKVTRVFGNRYRCNWWAAEGTGDYDNPSMRGGQIGTTHRIRKSQYLEVTKSRDGLRIDVISSSKEE